MNIWGSETDVRITYVDINDMDLKNTLPDLAPYCNSCCEIPTPFDLFLFKTTASPQQLRYPHMITGLKL